MLQAAIRLLQLSRLELEQELQQQLVENPILEEEATVDGEDRIDDRSKAEDGLEEGNENPLDERIEKSDLDWESYLEGASDSFVPTAYEPKEAISLENILSQARSISEHLLLQLHTSTDDEEVIRAGSYVIGNLNENGYLQVSMDEVAKENQVSVEKAEEALSLIQSFDPSGIAARDLKECLLLQLESQMQGESLAAQVINHCIKELEDRKWNEIAKKLNVSLDAVKEAIQQISKLDPRPGRSFATEDPQYIIPDVVIQKVEDKFVIMLNDDGLPRLRISPYYSRLLKEKRWDSRETQGYIEEKMRQAIWLIRSIEQRQRTLYKVSESLMKYQRRFFEEGIRFLRPLTLKEVAEDISMHESTVSRVTTNKFAHTPQGVFELKYFFHRGLSSRNGESVSSTHVKEQLRKIIQDEGGEKPISDQRLAQLLRARGVTISRRTVAKYRTQLKIPSSSRRKRF
jgi:RNA polymerase sigma-54 factor